MFKRPSHDHFFSADDFRQVLFSLIQSVLIKEIKTEDKKRRSIYIPRMTFNSQIARDSVSPLVIFTTLDGCKILTGMSLSPV